MHEEVHQREDETEIDIVEVEEREYDEDVAAAEDAEEGVEHCGEDAESGDDLDAKGEVGDAATLGQKAHRVQYSAY